MVAPASGEPQPPSLAKTLCQLPPIAEAFLDSGVRASELAALLKGDPEALQHASPKVLLQVQLLAAFGFRCMFDYMEWRLQHPPTQPRRSDDSQTPPPLGG